MGSEMTELGKKVLIDVQSEIWKYYDSISVEYENKEKPDDTIMNFFSYVYRLIFPTGRRVHYSKELSKKIDHKEITEEHIEILKKYEDAFLEGKDMNIFLSNNIKEPKKPDFLLYAWHLYHLHMSGKFVEDINQMKNNRSDTQLLCIIDISDVYFIDVIPHPTKAENYFNLQSLKIIEKNGWMEKIGFFEMTDVIPGSLKPKITEAKDLFELYKRGINIAFEFQGKAYASLSQISQARKPVDVTLELLKIIKKISKLNDVEGTYKGFKLCSSSEGILLGIAEFETTAGESQIYNIF